MPSSPAGNSNDNHEPPRPAAASRLPVHRVSVAVLVLASVLFPTGLAMDRAAASFKHRSDPVVVNVVEAHKTTTTHRRKGKTRKSTKTTYTVALPVTAPGGARTHEFEDDFGPAPEAGDTLKGRVERNGEHGFRLNSSLNNGRQMMAFSMAVAAGGLLLRRRASRN